VAVPGFDLGGGGTKALKVLTIAVYVNFSACFAIYLLPFCLKGWRKLSVWGIHKS